MIAEHAGQKYSGRIGRSAAAKDLNTNAIDLAVRAHVRHRHTQYDELLACGTERNHARALVAATVEKYVNQWQRAKS